MTLNQFVEKVERRLTRGIYTDESRWDRDYLISKCNDVRALLCRDLFIKERRWHPQLIQRYTPKYKSLFQMNTCIVRFRIPTPFISGGALGDGFIGAVANPIDEETNPYAFIGMKRIKNRAELHDMMVSPVLSKTMLPAILIEGLDCEVYAKHEIYKLTISGVFYEPQKIQGFRPDKDEYLITGDMAQMAEDMIFKAMFPVLTEPDTISNTKEDTPKR